MAVSGKHDQELPFDGEPGPHARNRETGQPDQSPEAFEPFLRVIKQSSNVVVNLTTGGSPYMTVEERVRPAATWKPLASDCTTFFSDFASSLTTASFSCPHGSPVNRVLRSSECEL